MEEQDNITKNDIGIVRVEDLVGEAAVAGHPVKVHAVAVMAGHGRMSGPQMVERIQKAMSDAVLECNAQGMSTQDYPNEIREAMAAARQRVLDDVVLEEADRIRGDRAPESPAVDKEL